MKNIQIQAIHFQQQAEHLSNKIVILNYNLFDEHNKTSLVTSKNNFTKSLPTNIMFVLKLFEVLFLRNEDVEE